MGVLTRPIRSLPAKDANGQVFQVAVSVVAMTRGLVSLWMTHVQPLVDAGYQHSSKGASPQKIRADVGWNWRRNFFLAAVQGLTTAKAQAMCLVIKQVGAPEFPIGMLTVVPQLPCHVFGTTRDRGFCWYLADAPFEAYTQVLKIPAIKGVAAALIDCSIQAAADASGDSTHLLHADPNGGDKLLNFYKGCNMTQLPPNHGPITPVFRRTNPEQYFHFDDAQASAYCAKYDPRR